ncbi:anti-sigma factor [Herbiconiux moechotypicola]|uniref:Regulator of SigK n=1 Tax=Herbiconiux moechotypicola TaxID=637393 RepID=A0ABN3E2D3_9MICO|nr:anti-sigma factor [Herbiconiux moechotypicola]MCS5731528.1 anti-sigma factor [Herbiconiux moechotypicola]
MTDRRDDELDPRSLTGAYALDAVTAEEAVAVERALDADPELAAETDGMREAAGLLGAAAAPVQPSARLRSDLLAQIARTPQDARPVEDARPVAQDAQPASGEVPIPAAEPARGAEAGPAERRAQRRWARGPWLVLGAAAAAAALFVGGGFLGAAVTGSAAPVVEASADSLAAIMSAPDSAVERATVDAGGAVTVVWSQQLGMSAVLADGLAPLPDGKVYEAWYIDADGAAPAGTFSASAAGTSWHVLDGAMASGDAIGVTVEPAGGSESPTTDPLFVVSPA